MDADFQAIGRGMAEYFDKTGTSMEMGAFLSTEGLRFEMYVATAENLKFHFSSAAHLIGWLDDINSDIDPTASAMARQRAEALEAQRLITEAQSTAVAQEIAELPETQRILDAKAEAQAILDAAAKRLGLLDQDAKNSEEAAAKKDAEAKAALAQATPEQLGAAIEALAREAAAMAERLLEIGGGEDPELKD